MLGVNAVRHNPNGEQTFLVTQVGFLQGPPNVGGTQMLFDMGIDVTTPNASGPGTPVTHLAKQGLGL